MNTEYNKLLKQLAQMGDVVFVKEIENPKDAFAYYFSLLDIEVLDTILSDKNYYDGLPKSHYINLIKIQFESLKAEGIHHLKPIPGICSGCKKGCSGFTFLDEVNGFYVDLAIEVTEHGNIDFTDCVNLKNQIEVANKKEQIFINEKGMHIDIDGLPF